MGFWNRYRWNLGNKWKGSRISPPLEVNKRISPWLEGLKGPRRMVNFFELLSAYIGLRLWSPKRLKHGFTTARNTDENRQSTKRFHIKDKYTSKRPTSWMLQEIDIRSLTNSTSIISNRKKGGSGKWPIFSDRVSRNIPLKIDNVLKGHQVGKSQVSG